MLGNSLVLAAAIASGGSSSTKGVDSDKVARSRFLAANLVRQGFTPNSFQEERAAYLRRRPTSQILDRIPTTEKVVALTFDDGPYPGHTERLLNLLRAAKIQATFFLIGSRVDDYPSLAKQVVEEGHEIGSHTYYHPNLTWLNKDEVKAELLAASWTIERHTGVKITMARPPGGQVSSQVNSIFVDSGLVSVLWTINPGDLNGAKKAQIVSLFSRKLEPGAILLLHDYPEETLAALPDIIKIAQSRGYRFVTLGDMVPAVQAEAKP